MMEQQGDAPEPLNNMELESAALGLRMALSDEEATEARGRFLERLRVSPLAVPTMTPVPTDAEGRMLPNAEINLLVVNTPDGVSGIPAFTTLGGLRAALPQLENGMFLTGGDLGNILGPSEHKLFVDGPDIHVEVETAELQQMAFITQQYVAAEQAASQGNEPLADALEALHVSDTPSARETVVKAFLEGFGMYPVAGEADGEAEAVVLSQQGTADDETGQELALLTIEGALPCFTSMAAFQAWDATPRGAIPIPGQMMAPLATQAEVETIIINPGTPAARTLRVGQDQVTVE